jgi:uncharacterized protein YcfJ
MLVAGVAALGVSFGAVAPASAQSYYDRDRGYQTQYRDPHCEDRREDRMVAGALIGGIAGAVLGGNVAADGARTEGAALGGALGAAAGAAIGRNTAECDVDARYDHNRGRYGDDRYGRDRYGYGYGYGRDGLYGAPPHEECRWTQQTWRDRRGRARTEDIYVCLDRDGVWRERR